MIEQDRKRRIARTVVIGLAVAAVAGVAIAGTAAARSGQSAADTAAAGGPDTPSAMPSPSILATPSPGPADPATPQQTPSAVPEPSLSPSAVPSLSPSAAVPSLSPSAAVPSLSPSAAPGPVTGPEGVSSKPAIPPRPAEKAPPANPVAACKTWLKQVADERGEPAPGPAAKVVARLDGRPGTVLVLADGKYWAGCDTAFARNGSEGSIRQPGKIAQPAPRDINAFAVAGNLIPIKGKQYEYYWAAGRLPAGVAKISYTFPDGKTTKAVVKGNYWLMQHQTATPWKEGSAPGPRIKVTLSGANGQTLRTFSLVWGEHTCAQISHGC
ncbi:hypothetical protein [Kribbella sp. CA-247076]|uniref:hypothetical protein n=1 Tax=Kribbella sp. CA-247076 TaxID=3239941 RepID=UPI003D930625